MLNGIGRNPSINMSCGKCILPMLNGIGQNKKNDLLLKSEANRFLFFYSLSFARFRYQTSAFRKLDVRLVSAKPKMK